MKVMITGAGGMTGAETARQAIGRGWECSAYTHNDLDISDPGAIERSISSVKPDVIINAAAYTAVDAAEEEKAKAMLMNAEAPRHMAELARAYFAAMIHISTDYVFDGLATAPYQPDAPTAPLNVYGESKLAGEIAVRGSCPRHAIVRTSWVYSHEGKNFVRTMLRVAEERDEIKVVSDQHGRPTSAHDLASALLSVADVMHAHRGVAGTFHFANSGETTWYEFAKEIFALRGGRAPKVTPITSDEFATLARRPRWSVLDTTSFEETFGIAPRPWREALADTMKRIQ